MVQQSLKNILIPVNFSKIYTESVIEKIIALVKPVDAAIHILHILKNNEGQQYAEAAKRKLHDLKQHLQQKLPSINISTAITSGKNVETKIAEKANELNSQMIVIMKKRHRKWLSFYNEVNATLIARETNASILIVNPEAIPNKIKSIVLPVRSVVPEKNIELLSALTGNNKPVIHLVTTPEGEKDDDKKNIFINTYRTLSDLLHYPVDYKVFNRKNFLRIVFGYGKNIMADLIFINPFDERRTQNVIDMISSDSKLCVLLVKSLAFIN